MATGFNIPFSPPLLEGHHLPGADRILDAVARLKWEATWQEQVLMSTGVPEFTLPDLVEGLTEAEIAQWLVEIGDVVAVDQPGAERGFRPGR
jgi:hypothetical protein